jgi:error-prone DNA polymerase
VIFLNLEDETGLLNVICSQGLWRRQRRVARSIPVLVVRGVIETNQGVVNLIAQHLTPLPGRLTLRSRDFR